MKAPTKIAMVGAGGIGCALTPLLSRLCNLVIVDGDDYEPKNYGRQFPALKSTENKAIVLAQMLQENTLFKMEAIPTFLQGMEITNRPEWKGVDFIIGGVDNNESRSIIVDLCDALDIPGIIAGNEHDHGEAHLIVPGIYDPFCEHEFVITPHTAPWGCNKDSVVEEFEQTPIANMLAAGAAAHILMSWSKSSKPANAVCYSRLDPFSSEVQRVRDYE